MRMEPTEFRNVGYKRYMDTGDLPKRQQITIAQGCSKKNVNLQQEGKSVLEKHTARI